MGVRLLALFQFRRHVENALLNNVDSRVTATNDTDNDGKARDFIIVSSRPESSDRTRKAVSGIVRVDCAAWCRDQFRALPAILRIGCVNNTLKRVDVAYSSYLTAEKGT